MLPAFLPLPLSLCTNRTTVVSLPPIPPYPPSWLLLLCVLSLAASDSSQLHAAAPVGAAVLQGALAARVGLAGGYAAESWGGGGDDRE